MTVLLGRGDGTFRLRRYFAARVNASRIASGDLNGDGSPDLVFSDGGSLAVMLNRGDATFQAPLWYGFADTLAAGDFNGDGRLDLAGAWVNDRNGDWNETVHRNRPGLCNVQDVRGKTLAVATDLLEPGLVLRRSGSARSLAHGAPRPRRLAVAALPGASSLAAARCRSCSAWAAERAARARGWSGCRRGVRLECLDQQPRVADLAAAAAAHEAAQLLLDRLVAPGRLLLQRAERAEVAVDLGNRLDRVRAERADQLALEVGLAGEEAELLEVVAEGAA